MYFFVKQQRLFKFTNVPSLKLHKRNLAFLVCIHVMKEKATQFHCAKLHITGCSDCWVCSRCLEVAVSWFQPFWKNNFPLHHWDTVCILVLYVQFPVFAFAPPPLGFVQFLQYYYQSGCLYRLRALGERNQLDLTVGALEVVLFCFVFWW